MTRSVHEGGRRPAREVAGDDRNARAAASRQKPIALRRSRPLDANMSRPRKQRLGTPEQKRDQGGDGERERRPEPAAVDDQRVSDVEPAVLDQDLGDLLY